MVLDTVLTNVRLLLADFADPPIWSDDVLIELIHQGETVVANELGTIIVADSDISITTGQDVYDLPEGTLNVYGITLTDEGFTQLAPSTETWTPVSSTPAKPQRYTLDNATGTVRVWPKPDADYPALMRVSRTPKRVTTGSTKLETEDTFLPAVCDWVCWRALITRDTEGNNSDGADAAKVRYERQLSRYRLWVNTRRVGNARKVSGFRIK